MQADASELGRRAKWQLWARGTTERQVDGITPLLASWEKSSHPAQIRLRAYLSATVAALLPLPADGPLFLHLDVDVEDPTRLLRHYDLENYLTPLFGSRWLPASRFVLVSARKFVGGGSHIAWGVALRTTIGKSASAAVSPRFVPPHYR